MKLKDLSKFNSGRLNNHQLSLRGKLSYPTVAKYLDGTVQEPSLLQIAKLLVAMGASLDSITVADLIELNGDV